MDTRSADSAQSAITPTLSDVAVLALAARQRGEAFVDVEMSGLGREWVLRVAVRSNRLPRFGLWGRVVARRRERPASVTLSVDQGPVSRILVRFGVLEVIDVCRREQIAFMTPPTLAIDRRRPRLRNIMIR